MFRFVLVILYAVSLTLVTMKNHRITQARSILVVGYVDLVSPHALAKSGFRTRHVYLVSEYAVEYAVVDYLSEGWKITYTIFAEEAFCGHWNIVMAEASPRDPTSMGQSGREVLKNATHLLDAEKIDLVSPAKTTTRDIESDYPSVAPAFA